MRSNTSKPSSFGIWISKNSRSGFNSFAAFTASSPLVHSATTRTSPWCSRYSRTSARAGASSSTITTVRGDGSAIGNHRIGGGGFERQADGRDELAALFGNLEPPRSAKLRLQPLTHQRQTDTRPFLARAIRIARIGHPHDQHRMLPFCADRDGAAFEQRGDTMQHRIFGQRLQYQGR